jgi:hypothetical protein
LQSTCRRYRFSLGLLVSISTSDFTRWRCQLPEAPWTFTLFWTSMCGYSVRRSLEFDLHDILFRRCTGVPIMGESRLQMGKAHASFALGCTGLQLFNSYSFPLSLTAMCHARMAYGGGSFSNGRAMSDPDVSRSRPGAFLRAFLEVYELLRRGLTTHTHFGMNYFLFLYLLTTGFGSRPTRPGEWL